MRRLILFRHGKAETAGLTGGDLERPLATRGREEAAATARWLLAAGFAPDLAIVSPSFRTRSSWDCARDSFPAADAKIVDRLYLATAEVIMDTVDEVILDGARTIMVVGHNPGLQDLGARLAHQSGASPMQIARLSDGFPTASACVFGLISWPDDMSLAAVYEPPKRPGESPRWDYRDSADGAEA